MIIENDDEVVLDNIEVEDDINIILDEKPRRRRRKKEERETEEYVNKEEMWNEIRTYYVSLGKDYNWETQKLLNKEIFPTISPRLTQIINEIAIKMGYRPNFINYSYKDEMIGDAKHKMFKALRDCSFKCFTTAVITNIIDSENGVQTIFYTDKKGETQKKVKEASDVFFEIDGISYIKFKANPFGYFSRVTTHSYLNRIKKEKVMDETKKAYQEETWEKLYNSENFRCMRRPKYIDKDHNDDVALEE